MVNLRAGASSLLHWLRAERAATGMVRAIDGPALQRELSAQRPDLATLLAGIKEQGVVAVPGYWSAERCALARAAFDRVLAENPASVQAYSGGSDRRLYGMESADPLFAEFHHDPFLKG